MQPEKIAKAASHWLARADIRRVLEGASRLGYAARGLVYLGLGVIVLLAASDVTPRAQGAKAMLAAWAAWPLGLVLVGAVAAGLLGFALWRALQAVFDADQHGASPKGVVVRIGQAISGLIYGGLGLWALELLDAFEDVGEADEEQAARGAAATVLALPYGEVLLLLAGAVMLGVGVGNIVQGLVQDFAKRLRCDDRLCRWVVPMAKVGYAARGLATLPAGLFLIQAGLEARSRDAHSWGGALQALEAQPFGSWMLGLVALGLIAFGLFGFVEARFRHIRPSLELTS
ncbi:DUF1206 domain-containing protein [Caulobacter sp.]|jgi:hypothetical protein|uniref:DUF1206 domain-containing protein n=1 Tax=Caulobacter sp. TaxID=78 RepID=UPI0031D7C547